MLVDYHIHTARCGHATGDMAEYLVHALEVGLAEVGFADHLPLLHTVDPTLSMSRQELPGYVDEVKQLSDAAPLPVRLGIEADYMPETVDELARLLDAHPFDYVLGSVHFLGEWGFDDPRELAGYENRHHVELYDEYFATAIDAVSSGLFDVLAHPDLIKKFDILTPIDLTQHYEQLAEAVAAADMAVEVSTAGLRKPVGEIYSTAAFLSMCRCHAIPVTLGSDAHAPEEVAHRFNDAVDLLAHVGYTEIATFSGRRRSLLAI